MFHYAQVPLEHTPIVIIDSEDRAHFQTMASAQLDIQERINRQLEARISSAERWPHAFDNSPQAIANIAANKLYVDTQHFNRIDTKFDQDLHDLPIYYIKPITVNY